MYIHTQNTPRSALELVKSWYATAQSDLLDPQIDCHAIGYGTKQSRYVGRDAMLNEFFGDIGARFSEWKVHAERLIDGGKSITAMGHYDAKRDGSAAMVLPFVHVWTVENDVITAVTACTDVNAVAA